MGTAHAPVSAVFDAIIAHEIHFGETLASSATQQIPGVAWRDGFLANIGQIDTAGSIAVEAWGLVVKRQTERVEQRAFAGSSRSANGEYVGGRQRFSIEVNLELSGQRR